MLDPSCYSGFRLHRASLAEILAESIRDATRLASLPHTVLPPPVLQVEIKRWQDLRNPNSVNRDPLFPNNKIADHEPGYPGLTFFVVS